MVKLTRVRRCEVVTEHVASVTAWTLPVFCFIGGNKSRFTFKKETEKYFWKQKVIHIRYKTIKELN